MTPENQPTRRGMLMKIGNSVQRSGCRRSSRAGRSIPPVLSHAWDGYDAWVSIGSASSDFPKERRAWRRSEIPMGSPPTAKPRIPRVGSGTSAPISSRCSPSTAPTSDVLFDGFRNRACSCARAMAARIIATARAPPVRRNAACSNILTKLKMDSS